MKDFIPKTEMAARKAMELDPTLAEPRAVPGYIEFYQWNWEGADEEPRRGIELNPNNSTTHPWYSGSLEYQGKFEDALSEIKRAQELDSLSPIINVNVAKVLYYMQRYALAIEQSNRALELDPNSVLACLMLGHVYRQQNKFDEAVSEFHKVKQIVGQQDPYGSGELGYAYAKSGRRYEAIKVVNQFLEFSKMGYALSIQIAWVYAGLGNKDKAFEWLEKGYIEQNLTLAYLKIDLQWDNLRSDTRYAAMLKKIGLER